MIVKVFIGVMGSGKDYQADKCDIKMSFADGIREDIWKMIGWQPHSKEEYEWFKETIFMPIGFTGRQLMQTYGTEVRRAEDEDHWVKQVTDKIKLLKLSGFNGTVGISDARFPNEVYGLIDKLKGFEVKFYHCDYHSDRYCDNFPHESEFLAQEFVGYREPQEVFNKLIHDRYEETKVDFTLLG